MALDKNEIARLYKKRAGNYDISTYLYYLIGFRYLGYRKMAVESLQLEKGGTVVEIGCGTGKNFPLLREAVGDSGRIIGVDLTPGMLEQARMRVEHHNWPNVELVNCDAASYRFPESVDGVISTFALTLVPEYDEVIRNGANALPAGKRFVVLDFKQPGGWPLWLVKILVLLTSPYGVSLDLAERHPWESMERYFDETHLRELYLGGVYIATGISGP